MGMFVSSYFFTKGRNIGGQICWLECTLGVWAYCQSPVRAKGSECIIIPSLFIILYKVCSNYKAQPTNSDVLRNTIFIISLKSM